MCALCTETPAPTLVYPLPLAGAGAGSEGKIQIKKTGKNGKIGPTGKEMNVVEFLPKFDRVKRLAKRTNTRKLGVSQLHIRGGFAKALYGSALCAKKNRPPGRPFKLSYSVVHGCKNVARLLFWPKKARLSNLNDFCPSCYSR